MLNRKQKGQLGELVAAQTFVSYGYSVYFPFGDNGSVDFVVSKNGVYQGVSVKSTSRNTVELRNVSRRKDTVVVTKLKECDFLVVYHLISKDIHVFSGKEYFDKSYLNLESKAVRDSRILLR